MSGENVRTILLVEDEPELLALLQELLAPTGVNVLIASNGAEALEMVPKHHIDAILSDINMPIMNGIKFMSKLKEAGIDIPIAFFTGNLDRETMAEALRMGAVNFVDKPVQPEKLNAVVANLLEIGVRQKSANSSNDIDELRRQEKMIRLLRLKNRESNE